jgi:AraC-like DNA-binding protein
MLAWQPLAIARQKPDQIVNGLKRVYKRPKSSSIPLNESAGYGTRFIVAKCGMPQCKTVFASRALRVMFAGQRPALQAVARELRLSGRTLQRRLTENGLTFQQLVKEARRELARHYLLYSSLELNETAYLLGYEDANSFFRAFQDWEGTTPGEWRASHAVTAAI